MARKYNLKNTYIFFGFWGSYYLNEGRVSKFCPMSYTRFVCIKLRKGTISFIHDAKSKSLRH